MKLDTMMEAIEVLARERGVAVDTILGAFANALVAAYKRSPGAAEEAQHRSRFRRGHRLRPGIG